MCTFMHDVHARLPCAVLLGLPDRSKVLHFACMLCIVGGCIVPAVGANETSVSCPAR